MEDDNLAQSDQPFLQDSAAFLSWFTSSEATRLSPKLKLADLRASDTGRAAVAKANIAEDEELFAIPRSLVLDVTNSDLQKHVNQPLRDFGSWNSLVVTVIYEYLREDSSPWYPYFKVLPTTFNTLMFWSPAELAELQGSAVVNKIGKTGAEACWKTSIIPFMRHYPALFAVDEAAAESPLVRLAHMAGSLIMAYAFDLDKNDDDEEADADDDGFVEDDEEDPAKGMVPFADMLNADAERNNARLFHEEDYLIMKATRSIPAGDEIFNDYGPLPRSDLLRMYGYVTDNYAPYDVVEISSQLVHDTADDLRKKYKKPKSSVPNLEDLAFVEDGYAIARPSANAMLKDAIPDELHMLITAVSGGKANSSPKKYINLPEADLLKNVLRKRLGEYQTTVDDDERILKRLGNAGSRLRMAVQVRKGEKEILQQLSRLAQECISDAAGKRKRIDQDRQPNKIHKK